MGGHTALHVAGNVKPDWLTIKKRRAHRLASTSSHNTVLGRIPPLTSDSYRNVMTVAAAYLFGADLQ